ncbi:MAG: permease [Desulfovibrio sp.]|jgi:cell division transport system permease protein|nr:permease [Desulfovibrio sp.]
MSGILPRLVRQGLTDLALHPRASIGAVFSLTLITFLVGLFFMTLVTLDRQLGMARVETVFQVYWRPGTDIGRIRSAWAEYLHLPGFVAVKTYTPEQAMAELGARLGRSGASAGQLFPFLPADSALPATALVSLVPQGPDPEKWAKETEAYFRSQPGVARVAGTPVRDEMGRAWKNVSRYVIWPSVAFMTVMLGLTVGNTLRLLVLARAHEIEILQLVGAFNRHIRLPFIVSGAVLGIGGGLFALLLLYILHAQIAEVLNFPPLFLRIHFPPPPMSALLVLAPAATAAISGALAVKG